jgi:hypothetical protein
MENAMSHSRGFDGREPSANLPIRDRIEMTLRNFSEVYPGIGRISIRWHDVEKCLVTILGNATINPKGVRLELTIWDLQHPDPGMASDVFFRLEFPTQPVLPRDNPQRLYNILKILTDGIEPVFRPSPDGREICVAGVIFAISTEAITTKEMNRGMIDLIGGAASLNSALTGGTVKDRWSEHVANNKSQPGRQPPEA